ncbi:MAG: 2-amino-4-hydroxy-6-hydroxymethyldihydropteridine diphosphokinase [Thermoanaerobaculaceae bacterium]|nr:2-amino-4-hydroxy-6-hydroxymethyldihydropteridine diphosphokinase [Thermoanaerobaculaceae bacterium]
MRMFLSIGSNVEPRKNLGLALEELRRRFDVVAVSPVYRTAPVGDTDQPDFWNLAAELATDEPPGQVHRALRAIEDALGRRREPARPFGPRTIDLDLVLADGLAGRFGDLDLPSVLVQREAFVAVPLADLAPDFPHPLLRTTIGELARAASAAASHPPEPLDVELVR